MRFVNVTWDLFWDRVQIDYDAWDTHTQQLRHPEGEQAAAASTRPSRALLEDLDERGLLDETLVVVMSEMGRTPQVNANGGRDHWTFCYSVLFAGAGIRGGTRLRRFRRPGRLRQGPAGQHRRHLRDRSTSAWASTRT